MNWFLIKHFSASWKILHQAGELWRKLAQKLFEPNLSVPWAKHKVPTRRRRAGHLENTILTPLLMRIQSASDISWAESTTQLRQLRQIWSCPDMISGLDFAILPPRLDLHLHQLSIKSLLLPFQAPLVCCGDHWPVCYWSGYFAIGENCTEDLLFLYNRQVYEKSLRCFPAPCWHIFSANI